VFAIEDREARRRAIIETFHPALAALGQDLLDQLAPDSETPEEHPLHVHLPRLAWPRGYEPFATWMALSRDAHGYQAGPQLNVGVHADHVAVRLGWDTASSFFGRFEFLSRHGDLGRGLLDAAVALGLHFRVYAAAPWPRGSRMVFESVGDIPGSFDEVRQRGVWWELGRRYSLSEALPVITSAELGVQAARIFTALLPLYDRIVGEHHDESE